VLFAAIPYGVAGALVCLAFMGAPFGFMAFLGIISLIGVIVSHVIVLFDFIEERHREGDTLRDALIDAGILRLRPVLITVAATVLALVPLALEGGPLWEPSATRRSGTHDRHVHHLAHRARHLFDLRSRPAAHHVEANAGERRGDLIAARSSRARRASASEVRRGVEGAAPHLATP